MCNWFEIPVSAPRQHTLGLGRHPRVEWFKMAWAWNEAVLLRVSKHHPVNPNDPLCIGAVPQYLSSGRQGLPS